MSAIQTAPSKSPSSSPLSWEEVEGEEFQMIEEEPASCSPCPEITRPLSTSSTQSQASSTCSQTPLVSQASTRSVLSDSILEQPSEESTGLENTNPESNTCLQAPTPRVPTPFPSSHPPSNSFPADLSILRQRGTSPKADITISIDSGPILEVEEQEEYQSCFRILLKQCYTCFCKQKV